MPDDDVIGSLCDDLNTPNVLTRLHALVSEIRGPASASRQIELKRSLKSSGALLGILEKAEEEYLKADPRRVAIDESKVKSLIDARAQARKAKNFEQADSIRDELARMGVVLKDSKDGTTWEVAR